MSAPASDIVYAADSQSDDIDKCTIHSKILKGVLHVQSHYLIAVSFFPSMFTTNN